MNFTKAQAVLILVLLVTLQPTRAAKITSTEAVVIAEKITFESAVMAQERSIYVSLPKTYHDESNKYPVLYVLDGDFFINMGDFVVKDLSMSHQIEDMIVVAVSQRNRHAELKGEGASKFHEFIKSEVFTHVNQNYRTNGYNALFGHSLGGSFALYSMMKDAKLFNAYMAVSPVIGTKDTPDMKALEDFLTNTDKVPSYLYLAKANEQSNYQETIPKLVAFLHKNAPKEFRWTYTHFPDKTHGTVPVSALIDSLSNLFEHRIMPAIGDLSGFNSAEQIKAIGGFQKVKDYYAAFNKKMQYDFQLPSIVYSRFAWIYFNAESHQLLADLVEKEGKNSEVVNYYLASSYHYKKDYERAIKLMKINLRHHPKHASGWHILGKAYRDSGSTEAALAALKKGFELAQDSKTADEYQAVYDQLLNNKN